MNRSRSLPALVFLGLLAACAPTADGIASAPPSSSATATATATITEEPLASMSVAPEPSESASAEASHDMGGESMTTTVEIVNFAFAPPDLKVGAGTDVTFINLDAFSHTVTAGTDDTPTPDVFDSGRLPEGDVFLFEFDEPGTYMYYCDLHPAMEATITVEN